MSTYNAFYVRKQQADDVTRAAILDLYPSAQIEWCPDYIGGVLSRDDVEPPEQRLAELSAKLRTDVIWVTYQTTVESFIFHHWRDGSLLRALWYGCGIEGTWDRVEGQPEPWEREAFWDDDEPPGSLEKGQAEPTVSSADAVHTVMEHYRLFADVVIVPPSTQPFPRLEQPAQPAKPKRKYGCLGCLFILLFFVAILIFAIIGVISLFK